MINITSAIALGISCSGFSFSISSVHYNSGSASGRGSPWSSRVSNAALLVIRGRGEGLQSLAVQVPATPPEPALLCHIIIKLLLQISLLALLPYQGNLYKKENLRSF